MTGSRRSRTTQRLRAVATRAVPLAALWYVISVGEARSWLVGVPVVLLAASLEWRRPGPPFRWWRVDHVVRFVFFYVAHAIVGGVDVALRALDPRRTVDPGFVTYSLRLPPGPARSLLIVTVSMLPGTVAADAVGRQLVVQRIHSGVDVEKGCRRAEDLIGQLFGLRLSHGGGITCEIPVAEVLGDA